MQSRCEKDEKDDGPCLRCRRQSLPCHEDPFFRRASKSRYAHVGGRYHTGQLIGATGKLRNWKDKFEPAWLQSTGAVDKTCPLTIHKDPFLWTKRPRLLQVQLSSLLEAWERRLLPIPSLSAQWHNLENRYRCRRRLLSTRRLSRRGCPTRSQTPFHLLYFVPRRLLSVAWESLNLAKLILMRYSRRNYSRSSFYQRQDS